MMELTEQDLVEFQQAFEKILKMVRYIGQEVRTPREGLFLMIGMRASHIEEATTTGDHERARAHLKAALKLLRKLEQT